MLFPDGESGICVFCVSEMYKGDTPYALVNGLASPYCSMVKQKNAFKEMHHWGEKIGQCSLSFSFFYEKSETCKVGYTQTPCQLGI